MKKKQTKRNAVLKSVIAEKETDGQKHSLKEESSESKKARFMEKMMTKKKEKMDDKGGRKR
jgi:hypothetical protein